MMTTTMTAPMIAIFFEAPGIFGRAGPGDGGTCRGDAGELAAGAGTASGCSCFFFSGFPQFLQNWFVSGFFVPHSPQNTNVLQTQKLV
jgi:hypothetical protein